MAKDKTVYNTATAIKYDIFADYEGEGENKESVKEETAVNKPEEKKEKAPKVSLWERLRGSLSTDKMFNSDNNQA